MQGQPPEATPAGGLPPLKLAGKTFVIVGMRANWSPECRFPSLIEAEGGRVAEKVTADLDFLLAANPSPRGQWADEKKAEQLIQKKGARIRMIDRTAFHQLLALDREEALALLRGGEEGVRRWNVFQEFAGASARDGIPIAPLAGADFRGARLSGVQLWKIAPDGCDFRGGGPGRGGARFRKGGARFDAARLAGAGFWGLSDCTLVGADLAGTKLNRLLRCDLTNATLEGGALWRTEVEESTFRNANLRKANLEKSVFRGNDFAGADLTGANLEDAILAGEGLAGIRLDGACLARCDLTGAALAQASLAGADLNKAVLAGADLTGADLRGADLANADLTGARLDGADFTGANVLGARIDADQLAAASGLASMQPVGDGDAGAHLRELDLSTRKMQRFATKIVLELGEEWVEVKAWAGKGRNWERAATGWHLYSPTRENLFKHEDAPSLSAAMAALANHWHAAAPVLESVRIEAKNEPKRKDLWALAVRAWAEAFRLPVPDATALEELRSRRQAAFRRWRDQLLAELRTGANGVERWNRRGIFLHEMLSDFTEADLREADLTGVCFYEVDLSSGRFDGARLLRGRFKSCPVRSAGFRGAVLAEARCEGTSFDGADFRQADLRGASFSSCSFRGVDFHGARLQGAGFGYGSLVGADLSAADLTDARFKGTEHDETTRWPADYVPALAMQWLGKGPNPAVYHPTRPVTELDFKTFLVRLAANVQPERLAKALAMLKADRFQLFAEVSEDAVIGVVKSQTDPDLVYSCRLASDGRFACCTQKLQPCGGLKDALCKHLLVLIVGLAKADRLNRGPADRWVEASRTRHPELDRDAMSETFIRFKGAEAGEIDWRPTETIPEDFYAL